MDWTEIGPMPLIVSHISLRDPPIQGRLNLLGFNDIRDDESFGVNIGIDRCQESGKNLYESNTSWLISAQKFEPSSLLMRWIVSFVNEIGDAKKQKKTFPSFVMKEWNGWKLKGCAWIIV